MTTQWYSGLLDVILGNNFIYPVGDLIILLLIALIGLTFSKSAAEAMLISFIMFSFFLILGLITWYWIFVILAIMMTSAYMHRG